MSVPAIEVEPGDAAGFVDCVDRIVAGMVFRFRPELVCLIRVHRWFDHRWMRFSGKGRVPFDSPFLSHPGVSLDPLRSDQLTFPPFSPSRIAWERHWSRGGDGDYAASGRSFCVHPVERKHSATNLHRRIVDLTASGVFVWFSSESAANRRGSVMAYSVCDGAPLPWFAALAPSDARWDVAAVKGLGRNEVVELLEHPPLMTTRAT